VVPGAADEGDAGEDGALAPADLRAHAASGQASEAGGSGITAFRLTIRDEMRIDESRRLGMPIRITCAHALVLRRLEEIIVCCNE
jgi:hypothetical protein